MEFAVKSRSAIRLVRLAPKFVAVIAATLALWLAYYALADEGGDGRDAPGEGLPRYRLEVGQELVYRLTSIEDTSGKAPRDQMQWRVFVVRQNADGSWRLLIRMKRTFITSTGTVRARWNSLGYCDLQPNGTYTLDEQTAIFKKLLPHDLFCRLPDQRSELDGGWSYEPPVEQLSYGFRQASRAANTLQIEGRKNTPYLAMNQMQMTNRYDFDLKRGCVERVTWESEWQTEDGIRRSQYTIELESVAEREPRWISQFYHEANAYLTDCKQWIESVENAQWVRSVAACEPLLQKARAILVAGREKAELEILQAMYDANIEEHDQQARWIVDYAAQREAFFAEVPKFPTDWQTQDSDGNTFRLADRRGQIVVLDFWATSCEYCVLVAGQVKQLAAEYQGQEVVFLGMLDRFEYDDQEDVDREDVKARSLMKNAYQGIPTLEANKIVEDYRLPHFRFGYPLLIVLDQSGVVHELHLGYAGSLPGHMRSIIDGLLVNPVDVSPTRNIFD